MIQLPLEKITYRDIDQFVQQKWPEGKSIDYKREAYGNRDEDKKELLKDVSSFANTVGGDILIGVDEDKVVPVGIPGVVLADVDKEKLRLEGIIRQGLEPRIEFGIHHVTLPSNAVVFIIRVKESLLFPHRVVYQGKFGEFWGRSSAGKFSMDTNELRRAFTLSDSIYEQIKGFRQNRVALIESNETPVPLCKGAKLIVHLIPVSSFRSRQAFDVTAMQNSATKFPPLTASGWDHRLNLDGYLTYARRQQETDCRAYTQFFRNGIIECVLSDIQANDKHQGKLLLATHYEYRITYHFRHFDTILTSMREIGLEPPVWCFMSLTGVKDARIQAEGYYPDEYLYIDREVLMLPESVIEDLSVPPVSILKPMFDLVWNASGYAQSLNFDSKGEWIGKLS